MKKTKAKINRNSISDVLLRGSLSAHPNQNISQKTSGNTQKHHQRAAVRSHDALQNHTAACRYVRFPNSCWPCAIFLLWLCNIVTLKQPACWKWWLSWIFQNITLFCCHFVYCHCFIQEMEPLVIYAVGYNAVWSDTDPPYFRWLSALMDIKAEGILRHTQP